MEAAGKPEIVIGLVGPIGVDLDTVIKHLRNSLASVSYNSDVIRLTDFMKSISVGTVCRTDTYINKYDDLIEYADKVRRKCNHNAALAGIGITVIQSLRDRASGRDPTSDSPVIPNYNNAYILRQFKRREEV